MLADTSRSSSSTSTVPQAIDQPLGDRDGALVVGRVRHEHAELVAAQPGDRILLAQCVGEARSDRPRGAGPRRGARASR